MSAPARRLSALRTFGNFQAVWRAAARSGLAPSLVLCLVGLPVGLFAQSPRPTASVSAASGGAVWGVTNLPSPGQVEGNVAAREFTPGEVWRDTEGAPINAHGGGVLRWNGVYYWYGEERGRPGSGAVVCYTSTNLLDWQRAGTVLPQASLPLVEGRPTFVERPKVLFNPQTHKFVMWMHLEQRGYRLSRAGIALSDGPTNAFAFLKALRPVANTNDFAALANDSAHQREFGGTFRDMNLFVDDDGRAYVFYASEGNRTMYIVRLNAEFTGPAQPAVENQTWAKILGRQSREAPAPFKHEGKYFLVTSACTGWKPNQADCAVAENILGPYRSLGNPCRGPGAETTFGGQSTFVLRAPGSPERWLFLADRWNAANLPDSRYVWLPLEFQADGTPVVQWREHWSGPGVEH